ncbi:unnamed protein product [Mytilus coruscus]|uniref:Uncharacterized protein n=1 Tax=Mytilus coruscus TaxID=42192 RepID=A0A6J8A3T0_MYTCO|nr:unnamed protein product [Mytilus coruscus]
MSRTTPAEDDKNRLVENDNTAGEDAHSSTGHLNSVQNHKENRYKEHASSEDMAHVTTETVDETVNSRGDANESISSKQNETNDIPFEIVNSEHENNELSNIITETPEDIEHENNGMKTVISMHVNTEVPSTHQHKKKKKKKRSDAEEDMPSISEDVSVRYFPADEQNVNANGQNNGYIPDDEHSDAAPSNESGEVSVIDVPTSDNGDVLHQEQTYDDFHHQAQSNGDVPCQAQSNGDVPYQAPSNSGIPYQAQSNGDVPDQAQSNGDFHHPEISKEETENNAQAKMETFIHGKMCEIRRDITEDTNNSINQVKEEFTEKMRQQSDEIKEQISRNRADLAKAETKRKKKMQKMKDRIKECKGRLKKFEDENMKNQIEFDKRIKASGGKQDDARQKIKENINAIQKLRDEMNRLKEDLKQQISQHRSVSSATDSPSLTQTSQINESSPHTRMETQDLSHSITNSDDAAQSRPTGSLVSPGIPPASRNRRKKKKKEPSIHVTRDGSVQIKHKNNKTINFGNMGSIEILNVQHGVGFTADSLEVEVKSTDYDVI